MSIEGKRLRVGGFGGIIWQSSIMYPYNLHTPPQTDQFFVSGDEKHCNLTPKTAEMLAGKLLSTDIETDKRMLSTDDKTDKRIKNMNNMIKTQYDDLTYRIIGAGMEVHSKLGPGLKENIYQKAMEQRLSEIGLNYEPQKQIEVYFGYRLAGLLFIDILVERSIVVELKALSHPVTNNEIAQVITYLKAEGAGIGLLLNFGRKYLEHKRIFPPRTATEITEKDLRFGVRLSTDQKTPACRQAGINGCD